METRWRLESVFDDPTLRKTKFVLLHGGWPFTKQAASMTLKPNVYVDTSGLLYFAYPTEVAQAMRNYLETAPEKVLFGTDASPLSGDIGWEETAWNGNTVRTPGAGTGTDWDGGRRRSDRSTRQGAGKDGAARECAGLVPLLSNSRTTDSRVAAKSAEFLFCLAPRPAACALLEAGRTEPCDAY